MQEFGNVGDRVRSRWTAVLVLGHPKCRLPIALLVLIRVVLMWVLGISCLCAGDACIFQQGFFGTPARQGDISLCNAWIVGLYLVLLTSQTW